MKPPSRRTIVQLAPWMALLPAFGSRRRIVNPATIDRVLSGFVTSGRCVGCSALVWEKGREAYFGAFGGADRAAGQPMARDTIVQIYSMTKPVVGVALMGLYEKGLFRLEDPIANHIPELAGLVVNDGVNADGSVRTRPPKRHPIVLDFLRHTTGLATNGAAGPIGTLMLEKTYADYARALAAGPLERDPGTAWRYGDSVEIQGLLIERLSGRPLAKHLDASVFGPLGMADTGYVLTKEKQGRFAQMYERAQDGSLSPAPSALSGDLNTKPWGRTPASLGLVSTLDDYMRFARMLLNRGSLDGERILSPKTLRLMTEDHLGPAVQDREWLWNKGRVGFGIDFAVRVAPPQADSEPYGAVGEFFWDGFGTTIFWADPANQIAAVFFTQVIPYQDAVHKDLRDAIYDVTARGR